MGSKGGSTQTVKQDPWAPSQPYLKDAMSWAQSLTAQPKQYYPGQTYVGPLSSEMAGWGGLSNYNQMMYGSPAFGGQPFGQAGPSGSSSVPTYAPPTADPRGAVQPGSLGGKGGTLMPAIGTVLDRFNGYPGSPDRSTGGSLGSFVQSAVTNAQNTAAQQNAAGSQLAPALGGTPSPGGTPFGSTLQAGVNSMTGNTALGQMGSNLAGPATSGLLNNFAQGAPQVGRYGFDTSINPGTFTPQFGQAGGLDATGAMNSMLSGQANMGQAAGAAGAANALLGAGPAPGVNWGQYAGAMGAANSPLSAYASGQPDYSGLQGAVDAANAPILRQLNEQVIPGLNQRATFLNNETGGIKTLNSVLPEVGQRMAENAQGLYNAERVRALGAGQQAAGQMASQNAGLLSQGLGQQFQGGLAGYQGQLAQSGQASGQMYGSLQNAIQQAAQDRSQAAGLVGQGGLSAYGLGLQGAGMQSGLQQALAQQNLATDTTNAGLFNQYRSDLLGLGGLAGQLAGAQGTDAARWGALMPGLLQAGRQPYQDAMAFGDYQRGIAENALQGDMNRWNFGQQEPYDRLGFYNSILNGFGGLGGTQTSTGGGGSSLMGGLGGAATGAQLGSMVMPGIGTAIGGGLGALAGLFGW